MLLLILFPAMRTYRPNEVGLQVLLFLDDILPQSNWCTNNQFFVISSIMVFIWAQFVIDGSEMFIALRNIQCSLTARESLVFFSSTIEG